MFETSDDLLAQLGRMTRQLRDELLGRVAAARRDPRWVALWDQCANETGRDDPQWFADSVAQAITCGLVAVRTAAAQTLSPRAVDWLLTQADPLVGTVLRVCFDRGAGAECEDCSGGAGGNGLRSLAELRQFLQRDRLSVLEQSFVAPAERGEPCSDFYEQFLRTYDGRARRRHGVFYTPASIVSFMVRSVDALLREEFSLPAGLADESSWPQLDRERTIGAGASAFGPLPFVRVLDPAMGTGGFLLEVFDHVHRLVRERLAGAGFEGVSPTDGWNAYVARGLLSRIRGYDVMLAPVVLAQLQLAVRLARTGYCFQQPARIQFFLANTLEQPRPEHDPRACPLTVMLGNPPFSGISENRSPWIAGLLRGQSHQGGVAVADYFEADGCRLRERKHWLHDDYVKFIRYCHWLVESAGTGIVALVTNHCFLDNATFRGMRQQLLKTFPRISVVDLRGNIRSGRVASGGGPDEGVFAVGQGVAMSFLRRPLMRLGEPRVGYVGLRGRRQEKLATLESASLQTLDATPLAPESPHYLLAPRDTRRRVEYDRGFSLPDIMPVNSTAAVTARDGFVVAFDDAELRERIDLFRDPHVPDQTVQHRHFANTRSARYSPGDTRSWKLPEARRRMRGERCWEQHVRDCVYRPFDRRRILWVPWMVDWPREDVMGHLLSRANVALVARRQTPSSAPRNFFWVTDTVVVDGLIRSDNRGSESVFPLYLAYRPRDPMAAAATADAVNFSKDFICHCQQHLRMHWAPAGQDGTPDTFGPETLLGYIYALFHAPSYRDRFFDWLPIDFPRVFLPRQPELFRHLAEIGARLMTLHLLRSPNEPAGDGEVVDRSAVIGRGYPKYRDDRIWLDVDCAVGPVDAETWQFRVGSHQVCRKWLGDRKGRTLAAYEVRQFRRIVAAVTATQQLVRDIERLITAQGGWGAAFGGD